MRIDMRIRHGNAIGETGHPRGRLQFFFSGCLRPSDASKGRNFPAGKVKLRGPVGRCLSPRCRSCFIRCALGHSSSIADKFIPVRVAEKRFDRFSGPLYPFRSLCLFLSVIEEIETSSAAFPRGRRSRSASHNRSCS